MKIKGSKLRWIYLIGFFLILILPLFNIPPWLSPPAFGKTVIFRIILSLIIFLFLWNFFFSEERKLFSNLYFLRGKSRLTFYLLIALFLIFLLATIFSLDRHFSFWGSPYRAGGFLNFAFYLIFGVLAFLTVHKKDWQKIWNFALIIGVLVSIIAILQQFELFSKILIPYTYRPVSTLGNPIFLAIYLLLLSFLALTFGIQEKSFKKRFFYFSVLALMLYAILITETRATYLGLAVGILYFILFYPRRLFWLKISFFILFVLGILGFYFLKTNPDIFATQNYVLQRIIDRISSISISAGEGRISGWKVSLKAIKERPILGWGPENFSIGFDKYYDPSLPEIVSSFGGGWWDRAHSFIFDISISAGIPALIIYLSIFAALFLGLQKVKKKRPDKESLICHGVQATFLAYLTANFFSFDTFSTYLISFLLIGYSLHLTSLNTTEEALKTTPRDDAPLFKLPYRISKWRGIIIFLLFVGLVWFIYFYNIRPVQINKEINWAGHYSEHTYKGFNKASAKIEKVLPSHSFLDHYLKLQYSDIIAKGIKEEPERKLELAQKIIPILKEAVKIRPYYTRDWIFLASYTNILIEKSRALNPGAIERLKDEANYYLKKAHQLSPKRQEIFSEWIKTDLLTDEYQKAKEKAQQCIDLNPEMAKCWWLKGLAHRYAGEEKEARENIEKAVEKGYDINSKSSLLQLATVYGKMVESSGDLKYYQILSDTYQKLINIEPKNFQYHASLAYIYKMLGDYEKARQEAEIVLKLSPESKENVEEFLRSLR
ncbi:O-antigen ligase family protein [Patescibacteria group bacterium]|nr:O-antigen ligase family protein [Patescibacteria group bacterium]